MKHKMRIDRLVAFTFLVAVMWGCSTPNKISLSDLSYMYKPEMQFTRLKSAVYHINDTLSTVFVDVPMGDLKFAQDPVSGNFIARYAIHYNLMPDYESKVILDSATFYYRDSLNHGKDIYLLHSFDIPAMYPSDNILMVELKDLQADESVRIFVPVEKTSHTGRQDFLVLSEENRPLFNDYINSRTKFRIISNNRGRDTLYVRYYHRDFPAAKPPFVTEKEQVFDYKTDSIYLVPFLNGQSDWLVLSGKGFYHFQLDTTVREGLTLFRFYDGYPEINKPEQLVDPLRYITTREEYQKMDTAADPKMAADEFWLATAGNPDRARILIQKYYNHVEEANTYFHSYEEGWKTDRGILYIVFGKPNYVYRSDNTEEWVYGEPENRNSLRFTFVKVINPFSVNDYMLMRSPTFKDAWYITVSSWRR